MESENNVCNGCWKRGVCERDLVRNKECTCPCLRDGWLHGDDPMNPRNKEKK